MLVRSPLSAFQTGPAHGSIGTGGTPMELLEHTLKDVFYPELWEVRNRLTQIADEQGLK